tara:strand:- start:6529 stop:6732 length:204 start_codon:yes stop_codon:yes gene_type:complete
MSEVFDKLTAGETETISYKIKKISNGYVLKRYYYKKTSSMSLSKLKEKVFYNDIIDLTSDMALEEQR